MNRRQFLASTAVAGAALYAQSSASRPNIIFIMADDLGYGDLSCYGQKTIQTPNIDRLATEGVRFTQVYAGSTVCAPSRCTLMTGKHQGHAIVRGNRDPEVALRAEDTTVAEVLKRAGYTTALYGKWGIGGPVTSGRPNLKGFDDFFGYLSQWHAHTFYPEHLWENEIERFIRGNLGRQQGEYSHDLFTDRALKFLDRKHDKPFFLYLPYTIPHTNNELGRATGDGMEVPDYGSYAEKDWPNPEKGFAAMIERLDRDVGRIIDKLRERGIDGNTIVFFTSDNGPHREGGHDPDFFQSRGPLRGIKRDLYEGGIRVPTLARWPGTIKPGRVSDQVWAFWDVLPTLAELGGAAAPRDTDGISMVPALLGKTQKQHEYLYWEFHERGFRQAIRMGDWKGIRLAKGAEIELYDLAKDLGEENNIAGKHPDIVRKIEQLMKTARTESKEFPLTG